MSAHVRGLLKTGHVLCISEGSAEEVIIKKLFENNKLVFKDSDIYNGDKLLRKFSRTRQGKKFAKENLEMDYGERPINILRILDSRSENFNLGKVYEDRIKSGEIQLLNVITRPEIEMLIIINEGYYDKFTNKGGGIKANDFCKTELGMKGIKSKKFVSNYFDDVNILVSSINRYKELHGIKNEYCLFNLLE